MKFKDLKNKKILYKCDLGDEYYWNEKLIVEIDKDYVCLLNYGNSYSSYIEYSLESVDEGFIDAFFNLPAEEAFFKVENETIKDYIEDSISNDEIIMIAKKEILPYLKKA